MSLRLVGPDEDIFPEESDAPNPESRSREPGSDLSAVIHSVVGRLRSLTYSVMETMTRQERLEVLNPWKPLRETLGQLFRWGFQPVEEGGFDLKSETMSKPLSVETIEQLQRLISENGPNSVCVLLMPNSVESADPRKHFQLFSIQSVTQKTSGKSFYLQGRLTDIEDFQDSRVENDGTPIHWVLNPGEVQPHPSFNFESGMVLVRRSHGGDGGGNTLMLDSMEENAPALMSNAA